MKFIKLFAHSAIFVYENLPICACVYKRCHDSVRYLLYLTLKVRYSEKSPHHVVGIRYFDWTIWIWGIILSSIDHFQSELAVVHALYDNSHIKQKRQKKDGKNVFLGHYKTNVNKTKRITDINFLFETISDRNAFWLNAHPPSFSSRSITYRHSW